MEQAKLFTKGSGQRPREAAVVEHRGKVTIRIAALKLESPNATGFASKKGAMGQARRIRNVKERVYLEVLKAIPDRSRPPSRMVITRLSKSELDRDNAWSSTKPVWDGIAVAFGLPNDRELQRQGEVRQAKTKGFGVVIEMEWA